MSTTVGKAPKDFYRDILRTNNNNGGLSSSSSPEKVIDGHGTNSALSLTQQRVLIQPSVDNTTLFQIKDSGGNNLMSVDSKNSLIKHGPNSQYVNTQYHSFGTYGQAVTDETWTAMMATPVPSSPTAITFGTTSLTPAATLTISTTSDDVAPCLFYVWDNMVIAGIRVFCGASGASTDDDLQFALVSYEIDTANGATSGDLSDGEIIAVSGANLEPDRTAVDYQALTHSGNVIAAGRVLVAMFRNDGDNNTIGANLTMKYYIV